MSANLPEIMKQQAAYLTPFSPIHTSIYVFVAGRTLKRTLFVHKIKNKNEVQLPDIVSPLKQNIC